VRHGLPGLANGLVTGLVGGPSAPPALLVSWLQQLLTAKEATNEASRGHLCHRIHVCDAARAGGRLRDPPAQGRRERRALYVIQLLAMGDGSADLLAVKVPGVPSAAIRQGAPVKVAGLVAQPWTMGDRSGVSFRANTPGRHQVEP
jgi:hypothetical protein